MLYVSMPLINLEDVSKVFGFGDATSLALDSINLIVQKGEFVAFMGPSGSGKSTLMNMIGLLDKPSHGSYLLDGKSVARLRPNQSAKIRRDTIGFIFQSSNLLSRLNVLDNVALPLAYRGFSISKRTKLASDMLNRVGISHREYFFPSQLSGGQLQCAAIARALVNNPKLIIADEPTGNLDSIGSRLIMELLTEIHKMGNTVLFVTHNPELTRYANRVVYMHDGAIIHDETTPYGRVAKIARRSMYTIPDKTDEDDYAGVSILMHAFPDMSLSDKSSKEPDHKKNMKKTKSQRKRRSKK